MTDNEVMEPIDWRAVQSLQFSLSSLVLIVCVLIWAAAGGGYFWPVWVLLGLGFPVLLQVAVRSTRSAPRRWRLLAGHGALSGVIAATLIAVWGLTGGGFWLAWPILGLTTLIALNALITTAGRRLREGPREQALAERVDVLTRTRRGALDVQAAELRRIERDLHDGAQARLVALSMQLGRAEDRLDDRPEVAELLRTARAEASAAIAELRDLARGIAPPVLADRGLAAAVEALGRRSALPVTVDATITRRLPPVVEAAAYFVVAEALTNAAKHAGGASAGVTLREQLGRLRVEIADDGPGGADPHGGGLTGLRHRVEALDGHLWVYSEPGKGTTVRAELPCES